MFATTQNFDNLLNVLGVTKENENIESTFDFITLANKGVDAGAIVNFRKFFKIPRNVTAELLNISEPTLYRWVRENKRLDRRYSIQLFELTNLFLYGTEVFGDQDNFFKWLEIPNVALGGMLPIKLLELPEGISKVKDLLGRIEHGVIS